MPRNASALAATIGPAVRSAFRAGVPVPGTARSHAPAGWVSMECPPDSALRSGTTDIQEISLMTPAVRISPRRDGLATVLGTVDIAQVDLGGIPRGAVLVLSADGDFEHEAAQYPQRSRRARLRERCGRPEDR